MALDKIDILLEKYFEGETTLAEENELKTYFSSAVVAPHLQQYQALFGYYASEKNQNYEPKLTLQKSKKSQITWISIAASVVVLLGVGIYTFNNFTNDKTNQELGTYDNPEEAFKETQKALAMLSNNVNVGIESIQYVENYKNTRDQIFITE
ncbi:hypothetical protein [Flavobacterium sp.]|uniref:hypothetical protein n=1 Tax=Flavobacterium sp. TaxID=239 RepID=UPI00286A6500|nr:hypothetical protein [Flavobacterium sp.]